jgi:hypothetical protein
VGCAVSEVTQAEDLAYLPRSEEFFELRSELCELEYWGSMQQLRGTFAGMSCSSNSISLRDGLKGGIRSLLRLYRV